MHTITARLLAGFFTIIVIFAISGNYITGKVNETGDESRQFVQQYWPTASLLAQARLSTAEFTTQAFSPPAGEASEALIVAAQSEFERLSQALAKTDLSEDEYRAIDARFVQAAALIVAPIRQFTKPGEQMEAADAAVGPVLDLVREIGDVDLTNTLWEGVMAFNDILITRDPAERKNFQASMQEVRNSEHFPALESRFKLFEAEALKVFDAAEQLYEAQRQFQENTDALATTLAELEQRYEQTVVFPASQTILEHLTSITKALVTAIVICILLCLSIGLYLSRDIGKASRQAVGMIESLAAGELFQRLEMRRKDEIGSMATALNRTADHLAGLVGRIGEVASHIAGTSADISAVSTSVTRAADQQAHEVTNTSQALLAIKESMQAVGESVEELATATELAAQSSLEMAANIEETALNSERLSQCADDSSSSILEMIAAQRQVAENIHELKKSSDITRTAVDDTERQTRQVEEVSNETLAIVAAAERDALDGREAVEKTTEGIAAINAASDSLFRNIENLKEKTDNIGTILTVIEDINSETSLLALNAAIIAAQAGEHGRSFGVVAEEIRDLSKRTGQSTEEITQIIHGVQEETEQAVSSLDLAGESIRDGGRLSQHSSQALEKIVDGFRKVNLQMERISAATGEQSKSSSLIQKTMHNVTGMIDQISIATSEQEKSNGLIQSVTTQLQEMSSQVRQSTREQSAASKTIGRSTEEINERIQQIKAACSRHDQESLQVEQAVRQISVSTESNVKASDNLEAGVAALSDQVTVLQDEMQAFKTTQPLQPDS